MTASSSATPAIAHDVLIEVLDAFLQSFVLARDEPVDHPGQHAHHRQPDQGVKEIEQGVGVGDLARDDGRLGDSPRRLRTGGDAQHEGDEEREDHQAGDSTEDVEERVGDRRAFGRAIRPDAGQQGRDGGADIVPEQDGHRGGQGDQGAYGAADGQRLGSDALQHADGGAAALNDHGHGHADQDAPETVLADIGDPADEELALGQRCERGGHGVETDEEDAEAQNHLAGVI